MIRRASWAVAWTALCILSGCAASDSGTAGTGRSEVTGGGAGEPDGGLTRPGDDGDGSDRTPRAESCNGLDDDRDGEVDEVCDCSVGNTQPCWPGDPAMRGREGCMDGVQTCVENGEFASWGACEDWVDCEETECVPEDPWAADPLVPRCKDGEDNDCDGRVDCHDEDCVVPGLTEDVCDDGYDDDCDGLIDCEDPDCDGATVCRDEPGDPPDDGCGGECIPGTSRWCDTPIACAWGKQDCTADKRWGACREVLSRPPGCSGIFYDRECCIDSGSCCQNFPIDDSSVGTCTDIIPEC